MKNWKIKEGRKLRIAISGKSGCGNTTVSALLAETLGITLINYTFRQLAAEKGMSLAEVIEQARTDDSYDRAVDSRQVALAQKESCVLGSRLAIWMLKEADLKAYLLADEDLRARRIQNREGGDLERIKEFTALRDREDSARYIKLYNIDNTRFEGVADIVIDTSAKSPDAIVAQILDALQEKALVESMEVAPIA